MADHALRDDFESTDAFLVWEAQQPARYEYVHGRVVAMAGARARHETVKSNLIIALGNRLRGGPCFPFGSDLKVRVRNGNIRYPDVLVDCASPRDLESAFSKEPRVIIEVTSPTNSHFEFASRLADYQSLLTCQAIVTVLPSGLQVDVLTRNGDGSWPEAAVRSNTRDSDVELAPLGLALPMAEIYAGIPDDQLPDTDRP
jgi:Uma2 family endonuclease